MDIAALLIKYNTYVNAQDRWGFTPLHEAAQKGRTQLCALLVSYFSLCSSPPSLCMCLSVSVIVTIFSTQSTLSKEKIHLLIRDFINLNQVKLHLFTSSSELHWHICDTLVTFTDLYNVMSLLFWLFLLLNTFPFLHL